VSNKTFVFATAAAGFFFFSLVASAARFKTFASKEFVAKLFAAARNELFSIASLRNFVPVRTLK
jgi:hypothetical protein